jgi:hypothetical protein
MKETIERDTWARYLNNFTKRNESRLTWLQIFGESGAQTEELGLPLVGISLDEKSVDAPRVQIMLGANEATEQRHLTHTIANVEWVIPQVGADGRDEAIEFIDKSGEASLLIFKHRGRATAHALAP